MTETTELTDQEYRDRALALANMLTAAPYRHNQKEWGQSKPENECGTAGCVAGWATLVSKEIVSIDPDGTMTWDPADLGSYADDTDPSWVQEHYKDSKPTLWRYGYGMVARETGREWLGLDYDAARLLFIETADYPLTHRDAVAVEILFRLADGRLSRDFTEHDVDLFELDEQIDARLAREADSEAGR
jgi:hypothetical protein